MNHDQHNDQSNNPNVSNAPVYDSTEKKRAFKRVMLFSLMFTIITLVGNYVSMRGSTGPYNIHVSFFDISHFKRIDDALPVANYFYD